MLKESYYNLEVASDSNGRVLMYNTSNAKVAWIDKDIYSLFHDVASVESTPELALIAEKGFLVDADRDELREQSSLRRQYIENTSKKTMNYVIAPSMACNYHCVYCFESDKQHSHTMTLSDADLVCDFLKKNISENHNCRGVTITWFGGEPTLALPQILHIGDGIKSFAESSGMSFESSIITNGYYLNRDVTQQLIKSCNLKNAQITIDGMPKVYSRLKGVPEEYFFHVVDNIESICDIIHVGVRINSTPGNEADIKELIRYLLSERSLNKRIGLYCAPVFNCSSNQLKDMFSDKSFSDFSEKLYSSLRDEEGLEFYASHNIPAVCVASCGSLNKNFFVIGPDLSLYRCEHYLGNSAGIVGNVVTGLNPDNDFDKQFFSDLDERCRSCKYLPICQGGCTADRLQGYNTDKCETMAYTTRNRLRNLLKLNNVKEYQLL